MTARKKVEKLHMFNIRYAEEKDKSFWLTLDKELSENEFILKVRDKRGFIICDNEKPVGVMRYNFCWDIVPFLTFIHIDIPYQKKGLGKQAMLYWENEMKNLGYKMLMTSTQVNEESQHFYRKLEYIDRGSIFLDGTPFSQPQEMFLVKVISVE